MCIASFNPIMTISSTAISFILPGMIIVLANVGIAKTGLRLRANTIKRMPNVDASGNEIRKSLREVKNLFIIFDKNSKTLGFF